MSNMTRLRSGDVSSNDVGDDVFLGGVISNGGVTSGGSFGAKTTPSNRTDFFGCFFCLRLVADGCFSTDFDDFCRSRLWVDFFFFKCFCDVCVDWARPAMTSGSVADDFVAAFGSISDSAPEYNIGVAGVGSNSLSGFAVLLDWVLGDIFVKAGLNRQR